MVVVNEYGAVDGDGHGRRFGSGLPWHTTVNEGEIFVDDPGVVVVEGVLEMRCVAVVNVVGDAEVPPGLPGAVRCALGEGEEGTVAWVEELGGVHGT